MQRLALAILAGLLASPAARAGSCAQNPEAGIVAAVTERLEIALEDGRLLRLAGLETPAARDVGGARLEAGGVVLGARLTGRPIRFGPAAGQPDRWGRLPAEVVAAGEGGADLSVAEMAAEAGLLRVGDAAEAKSCAGALLAAEGRARAARLGLWSDPVYAIVEATDRPALAARAGEFTLVEGRVRKVGAGRARHFLDFGTGARDFSILILNRRLKSFESSGLRPATLAGRRVRARGYLDYRTGPRMEIDQPAALELLPEAGQ